MSCINVEVEFSSNFWRVEPVETSLVIVFGFLAGILIAVLIARCFFKELAKERIQKSEQKDGSNWTYEKPVSYVPSDEVPLTGVQHEDESSPLRRNNRKGSSISADGSQSQATMASYDVEHVEEDESNGCLIAAFTKTSLLKTQTELSLQDYREMQKLEEQLQQEKTLAFLQLLRIILGKFAAKERLDEQYAEEFFDKFNQYVEDGVQTIASEQVAAEDEARSKQDFTKDPLALEEALEGARRDSNRKMGQIIQDAQMKIRDGLSKDGNLDEEEIDALFEKLTENMVEVEKLIGAEATRQAAILQERLERRKALAQQYAQIKTREEAENQTSIADVRDIMEGLVDDQHLLDEQSESILKQFEADLAQIQENHQAEVMRQSLQLSEKLQKFREKRLRKQEKRQEEEMEELKTAASKAVNISDFVQAYHNLLEQHRDKRNNLLDELDHREVEDLLTLRQQLEQSREESIASQEESLFEILAERARMSEKEANKIIRRHEAHMKMAKEKQDEDKSKQRVEIQDRLAECKALWEEQQQRLDAEQHQLAEQQAKTIGRLLDTQSGLDEDARRQILIQHEQNTLTVNNRLQMTKMKHEKLLEAKLAQRRAKMELLREKQSEELQEAAGSEKRTTQLKVQHAQEIAAEMKAMEQAEAELRSHLARETKDALKAQDEQLGVLIGKLQVGQARRQNIIKKQDKTIKELQDQLVDSVSTNPTVSEQRTNRIIQRHLREVEVVEDKLREAREHQARVLQEKYEAKKLLKEKTFVAQLEDDKREISKLHSKKIAQSAVGIMNQMLLETRHKQTMRKLEQEMKRELADQKEELNQQLGRAMVEELQEQEKNFLSQLAAVNEMSKGELLELVNTAVAEGGGDSTDVKTLSKDLTQRIKAVKSQPDYYDDDEEEPLGVTKKKKTKGKFKKK